MTSIVTGRNTYCAKKSYKLPVGDNKEGIYYPVTITTFFLQGEPLTSENRDCSQRLSPIQVILSIISNLFGEGKGQVDQFWLMNPKGKPEEFEQGASFLWKQTTSTTKLKTFAPAICFCL